VAAVIFTIGHSTHSSATLIELLKAHDMTAVADVRSQPYSRMNPQFNRETFQVDLKGAGIRYVFLGQELGARTTDRGCFADGKVQYDRLARTPLFQEGLARIETGLRRHRIALLCAEKDPLTCHRTILVCRHLVARGIQAKHILGDGRLENHEEALLRLMSEVGIDHRDLFRSGEDLIAEAYAKRAQQIAYVEKPTSTDTPAPRVTK
jgi:uncharacterized protein (DUF488 family)